MLLSLVKSVRESLAASLHRGGTSVLTGNAKMEALEPDPIPAEWVEVGNPKARSKVLSSSPDGRLQSGLWDCTDGRFTWIFEFDEVVQILEGEVIVESNGVYQKLGVGDVAHFPYGTKSHWHVPKYVKKFWTQRFPSWWVRLLNGRPSLS